MRVVLRMALLLCALCVWACVLACVCSSLWLSNGAQNINCFCAGGCEQIETKNAWMWTTWHYVMKSCMFYLQRHWQVLWESDTSAFAICGNSSCTKLNSSVPRLDLSWYSDLHFWSHVQYFRSVQSKSVYFYLIPLSEFLGDLCVNTALLLQCKYRWQTWLTTSTSNICSKAKTIECIKKERWT